MDPTKNDNHVKWYLATQVILSAAHMVGINIYIYILNVKKKNKKKIYIYINQPNIYDILHLQPAPSPLSSGGRFVMFRYIPIRSLGSIAIRLEAIASRLEAITTSSKKLLGWRPSLPGWRLLLRVTRRY